MCVSECREIQILYKGEKKKDKEGKTWICVNKGTKYGWIRTDLVALG